MSQEPHLLEKRAAYESLSNHLTQLPRKLTHPGLIPIAPRLYLPGELIRTNEILVLLGRSGEASYFAERTAWQAHQIVRRRLGHVEQGLRDLLAGVGDVHVSERPPSTRKKRVTFREPVICASPPLKARPRPNSTSFVSTSLKDNRDGDRHALSEAPGNVTIGNACTGIADICSTACQHPDALQSPKEAGQPDASRKVNHAYDPVINLPQRYLDVLRAAELDEDSSDDDMEGEYANCVGDDYSQFLSKSPAAEEASEISTEHTEPGDEPKHDKQEPTREGKQESEQHLIRLEFQDVLRNAEKQAREEGVVNLMEFYEDKSATPSHVTLPPHFQPDSSIDFDDDAGKYLDITGESANATKDTTSVLGNHLEFLREESRKEEEEERRKTTDLDLSDANRRREKLEREKKEFGTGFAKGFLGAPSKGKRVSKEQDIGEFPAPHVRDPEVSELQETGAVEEKVVERQVSRKSPRRLRKPQLVAIPEVMSVKESQQDPEERKDELAGRFTRIEDLSATEGSQMSKFRQLRKLKRVSSDKVTNR